MCIWCSARVILVIKLNKCMDGFTHLSHHRKMLIALKDSSLAKDFEFFTSERCFLRASSSEAHASRNHCFLLFFRLRSFMDYGIV